MRLSAVELNVNIPSSDYEDLKTHFKGEHFLCEDGECANAQFTNAFRTDIDLKGEHETAPAIVLRMFL